MARDYYEVLGVSRDAGPVQWNASIVVRGPAVLPLRLLPV